jgi:predicted DNA-binding transcriptional regulator AlpA
MTEPSGVMSIKDFCREMQISKTAFYERQKAGDVPPTFTYGRQVRMLRVDFEAWLKERSQTGHAAGK